MGGLLLCPTYYHIFTPLCILSKVYEVLRKFTNLIQDLNGESLSTLVAFELEIKV